MKGATKDLIVNMLGIILIVAMTCQACSKTFSKKIPTVEYSDTLTVSCHLSEWEILQLAIIRTESEFNTLAVGKTGDLGIFQITPIYVKEVNRILGEERYIHTDAFDLNKSIEMFNIIQNHKNPQKDISKAIYIHNPGGDSIGYSVKVRKNMEWIKKYESIRSTVTRCE